MPQHVVPMLHVPDVRATASWYATIGFSLIHSNEEDGEMNWALLAMGDSRIMLDAGGRASDANRREVDLYIHTNHLDALRSALAPDVDIVEEIHDTFYGTREIIIRDNNRFWITFGEPR